MPIEESTYRPIRNLFCLYLKIVKKQSLEETLSEKYENVGIFLNEIENTNEEVIENNTGNTTQELVSESKSELKPSFIDKLAYFLRLKKKEEKEEKEEKKETDEDERNKKIQIIDRAILELSKNENLNITYYKEVTKDTQLLTKDFDLIPGIRNRANSNDGDESLKIYNSYLEILFKINENILEPFGFYIANSLFEKNDYKRIKEYYKYIIIFAINSRFIALYNKEILLKQLEDLLRDITKTLYTCYHRTESTASSVVTVAKDVGKTVSKNVANTGKAVGRTISDGIEVAKDVGRAVGKNVANTGRAVGRNIVKGLEDGAQLNRYNRYGIIPSEFQQTRYGSIGGGSINQKGGLLYINTNPVIKKTEGTIIMLNNLFQSKNLTIRSLTQEYNATSSSKVSWLFDILVATGIVLSGGVGSLAISGSAVALAIGNASLCGVTGGAWTFSRDALLKSYHYSADLDDTLEIIRNDLKLEYKTDDPNLKLDPCVGVRESKLESVYKNIDEKIKTFSDTVIESYQKYLDIFEFIVKSRENILGDPNKYCAIPVEQVLTDKDLELKQVWLPILQNILDNWPTITGKNIIAEYTKTRENDFKDFFKAIDNVTSQKCVLPTKKELAGAIGDIVKFNGQPLISSLKTRFKCKDETLGGNRKTRRLKKRRTQKQSRKRKLYKRK